MTEESEKQALEDLENNIPYDYCRSCDSPDDLYHEYIDEDSWQYKIKMLLEEKDKEIKFHKNNERIAIDCQNKLNEEIERLNNGLKDIKYIIENSKKTSFGDLVIVASDLVCIVNIIDRLIGSDKE